MSEQTQSSQTRPSLVKRALSAHAAIGLLAGALLYLVCVTGTIAVLHEEFQLAEQPGAPRLEAIAPASVQRAIASALASEAGQPLTTHLYVQLPTTTRPLATVRTDSRALQLDAQGRAVQPEAKGWSQFLLALHYSLNLPGLIGVTIVGVLGVMMLALALSGVIALPRIFRDAFRLRARSGGGLALADWHNRLSVWTLPFTLAIALTGAVLGLASVALYAIAVDGYGGDMEQVYAPLFGDESVPDDRPAPLPDVAAALGYMAAHYPAVEPTYVVLHDPLTAGQYVQVVGLPPQELIFGEYYIFDGAGNFVDPVGLADGEIGQQIAASNYNLHFGNFAGLVSKLAYVLLGTLLSAICATGTYIWLGKRRRRGIDEPRLCAAWGAVVWGTPVLLVGTFIQRMLAGPDAPFATAFWSGLAALVLFALVRPMPEQLAKVLRWALLPTSILAVALVVAS